MEKLTLELNKTRKKKEMLGVAIATTVLCVLVVWTWQLLNWAWFRPRKMEKLLRKQGMKGNPYKFLVGDSKETSLMYEKAFSKPIGLHDDIVPRVMPNILHTLQQYGTPINSLFSDAVNR